MILATRGSPLALAQAGWVRDRCQSAFPDIPFEIRVFKTTGDLLQQAQHTAAPAPGKGLFTKELEGALLRGEADLAVHSLKDLPTELPPGLVLGAVSCREDVRDVLVLSETGASLARHTSDFNSLNPVLRLPPNATLATNSPRRKAQLIAHRADLNVVQIRGNVGSRLKKLSMEPSWHGLVLAAAGLARLGFSVRSDGCLLGEGVPEGLVACFLEIEVMLPCVGQGALGIEVREGDVRMKAICDRLNHEPTRDCVTAERAFLAAMGGGCNSPIAACARVWDESLEIRGIWFQGSEMKQGKVVGSRADSRSLGRELAAVLKRGSSL